MLWAQVGGSRAEAATAEEALRSTMARVFGQMAVRRAVVSDLLKVLVVDPAAEGLLQPCDFRVAKNLSLTESGRTYTLCGSPHYFAPEMLTGKGHGCEDARVAKLTHLRPREADE